jgi:hypothetical protein
MLAMAAKGHAAMKSKLLPVVVLILWFGAHGSFAQDGSLIIAIRAEVAQINGSLSTCTKTTKSVEGISLEGTEANYYSRGKELKKIAAKMYGETYNAAVELYYKDDMLTFAYYRLNRYDKQIGMPKSPKIVSSLKRRFYFSKGELVKVLLGTMEVKAGSEQWRASEATIASLAQKLRSEFEEKQSNDSGPACSVTVFADCRS